MAKTQELKVEGMSCANCALSVTKAIEKKGGKNVHVDFMSGDVIFDRDEVVDLHVFEEAIEGAGYSVHEANEQENESEVGQQNPFQKSLLASTLLSLPLLGAMFFPINGYLQAALAAVVVGIGTKHFFKTGLGSIHSGIANMDVLVLLGAYASFAYSLYNVLTGGSLFFETAAIIITLVLLGKFIEKRALAKAQDNIKAFSKLLPQTATKVNNKDDREGQTIAIGSITPGNLLLIRSGEKIPADGTILSGIGRLNESLLTGESEPVKRQKGEKVIAGSINEGDAFVFMANKVGDNTYLSAVMEMVKKAKTQKPDIQKTADKIAALFVPIVIAISIVTFAGWLVFGAAISTALLNAIAVLVISCPCAMGLATPTAVTVALGRAAKSGIFFKSAAGIEALHRVQHLVIDKTGTLTDGAFALSSLDLKGDSNRQEVVNIVYGLEQLSLHPIAKSLTKQLKEEKNLMQFVNTKEEKGKGVYGEDLEGNSYWVGKSDQVAGIAVMKNDTLLAELSLTDSVRDGATDFISLLSKKGVTPIMLSGDKIEKCQNVAQQVGIHQIEGEKLPEEKLSIIGKFNAKGMTAFVGDGINDGPALSQAGLGISLAKATDVALASADIVINETDFFSRLSRAFTLSEKAYAAIKQNLFWAFFYNVIAIPLAILGYLNPMIAAAAMSLSSLFVVGNSLRLKNAIQ